LDSASISEEEEEEVEGAAKAEMDRRDRARVVRENRMVEMWMWEDGSKGGLMSWESKAVLSLYIYPPSHFDVKKS
jgi:hypothetical protein